MKSQSNSLVVRGSLQESQKQKKLTFAEAFITVDAVLVVDISLSMEERDVVAEGGHLTTRWDEANNQLRRIQRRFPGRVAVVAFSHRTEFCPDGQLPPVQSNTDMLDALKFVAPADGCGIKFIVASDGEPDEPEETLKQASHMSPIDAIHIGTSEEGRRFMERLAKASGGKSVDTTVDLLEDVVVKLLSA